MQAVMLRISIADQHVDMIKRIEAYTTTDFLAICGGLLGLFLGISVLSVIEFIYFATLRLYWTIHRWKADNVVTPFQGRNIRGISINMPNI